jgi:hypothetical protein
MTDEALSGWRCKYVHLCDSKTAAGHYLSYRNDQPACNSSINFCLIQYCGVACHHKLRSASLAFEHEPCSVFTSKICYFEWRHHSSWISLVYCTISHYLLQIMVGLAFHYKLCSAWQGVTYCLSPHKSCHYVTCLVSFPIIDHVQDRLTSHST